jgi:hypothetical protein
MGVTGVPGTRPRGCKGEASGTEASDTMGAAPLMPTRSKGGFRCWAQRRGC